MSEKLIFGFGNAKLKKSIVTFSIPAGYTCPGALTCKAKVHKTKGYIIDGRNIEVRCFAATDETRPSVRKSRWHNFDLLNRCDSVEKIRELILYSMPDKEAVYRVHVSGDFYSTDYLLGWLEAMGQSHDCRFYSYTKSLLLIRDHLAGDNFWPSNFQVTASMGGTHDDLYEEVGELLAKREAKLGRARIVNHPEQAAALGLVVDHDDSHARRGDDFALLIHGTQPKGSPSAEAIRRLKKEKIGFSYTSKR